MATAEWLCPDLSFAVRRRRLDSVRAGTVRCNGRESVDAFRSVEACRPGGRPNLRSPVRTCRMSHAIRAPASAVAESFGACGWSGQASTARQPRVGDVWKAVCVATWQHRSSCPDSHRHERHGVVMAVAGVTSVILRGGAAEHRGRMDGPHMGWKPKEASGDAGAETHRRSNGFVEGTKP